MAGSDVISSGVGIVLYLGSYKVAFSGCSLYFLSISIAAASNVPGAYDPRSSSWFGVTSMSPGVIEDS
jgi:hypothetical protein